MGIGYRWFGFLECSREYLRWTWLEVSFGRPGLSLALCNFGDDDGGHFTLHVQPIWPNIYLRIPFWRGREPEEMMDQWGFSFDKDGYDAIHFNWGNKTKIVYLPWSPVWVRTSTLLQDGGWHHETHTQRRVEREHGDAGWRNRKAEDLFRDSHAWYEEHPYRYVLNDGTVQDRVATIKVEEREWRPRWFMWTRLFANVRRSIDVAFNAEVGERTGSWKGGVLGCGYTLKRDETPYDCLRRMERERKFR